jgi:GT2 family glycosyltransferase
MSSAGPLVTIGVPIYRSADMVAETLDSIRAQTFTRYRVLMSVDGGDQESAEVARAYTDDPRFELHVHETQLGWTGNINWCAAAARTRYFQYWQHDDLAEPDYIANLYRVLKKRPDAAVAYCDVRWFQEGDRITAEDSVEGDALSRIHEMIDRPRWTPFRGLIRTEAVRRAGPLRTLPHKSAMEDLVWNIKLGGQGALLRVPGAMYLKRIHANSLSTDWNRWSDETRTRDVWMAFGSGALQAIWPHVRTPQERWQALLRLFERLALPGAGRWSFYTAVTATEAHCSMFVAEALSVFERIGVPTLQSDLGIGFERLTERLTDRLMGAAPRAPTWASLDLLNGWQDFGAQYATTAYCIGRDGWVSLKGQIKGGDATASTHLAYLPPNAAPAEAHLFLAPTWSGAALIGVDTSGAVYAHTPADAVFTVLDGIRFPVR